MPKSPINSSAFLKVQLMNARENVQHFFISEVSIKPSSLWDGERVRVRRVRNVSVFLGVWCVSSGGEAVSVISDGEGESWHAPFSAPGVTSSARGSFCILTGEERESHLFERTLVESALPVYPHSSRVSRRWPALQQCRNVAWIYI